MADQGGTNTELPTIRTWPADGGGPAGREVGKPATAAPVEPGTPVVSDGKLNPLPGEVTR